MSTPVVHCWVSRAEALGYAGVGEAIGVLGVEGLTELWRSSGRTTPVEAAIATDPWLLTEPLEDICLALEDHPGDHDFVSADSISVTFLPELPLDQQKRAAGDPGLFDAC